MANLFLAGANFPHVGDVDWPVSIGVSNLAASGSGTGLFLDGSDPRRWPAGDVVCEVGGPLVPALPSYDLGGVFLIVHLCLCCPFVTSEVFSCWFSCVYAAKL